VKLAQGKLRLRRDWPSAKHRRLPDRITMMIGVITIITVGIGIMFVIIVIIMSIIEICVTMIWMNLHMICT
jgi:hypothetical protein